jgi:hypothetical protein
VSALPVADRWFRSEAVAPGLTLLVEQHLDPFFESNERRVHAADAEGFGRPKGSRSAVMISVMGWRRRSGGSGTSPRTS